LKSAPSNAKAVFSNPKNCRRCNHPLTEHPKKKCLHITAGTVDFPEEVCPCESPPAAKPEGAD
jgi:hypothetical protein